MNKIVFYFNILLLLSCVQNEPTCFDAELVDVLQLPSKCDENYAFWTADSAYRYVYGDYFCQSNRLIIKFSILKNCCKDELVFNQFGDMDNKLAYKLFNIINDTAILQNYYDSTCYDKPVEFQLSSNYGPIPIDDHEYYTVRVEDVKDIQEGFVCIKFVHGHVYEPCAQCKQAFKNIMETGVCFRILNGKIIKGKPVEFNKDLYYQYNF
jgi:hypothetical protein